MAQWNTRYIAPTDVSSVALPWGFAPASTTLSQD